jgi:hypothetical protein
VDQRPGWATTEFWQTLAAQLIALATIAAPGVDVSTTVQAITGAGAAVATLAYVLSRTRLKLAHTPTPPAPRARRKPPSS